MSGQDGISSLTLTRTDHVICDTEFDEILDQYASEPDAEEAFNESRMASTNKDFIGEMDSLLQGLEDWRSRETL